jgi:hypothetical protein
MTTKVYGVSDDLIEFEGDVYGEVGCYGTEQRDKGVLLIFSDGTILEAKYGKGGMGVWSLTHIKKGDLFDRLDYSSEGDADQHSDVVYFKDGLKWAYYCTKDWGLVE